MFKKEWEKASSFLTMPERLMPAMVHQAFPGRTIHSIQNVSDGCSNQNLKIMFHDAGVPLFLRIYGQNLKAARREKELSDHLKTSFLVPEIYYLGTEETYHFALVEWVEGVSMRDVILSNITPIELQHIMSQVGLTLQHLHSIRDFGPNTSVIKATDDHKEWSQFVSSCLENPQVVSQLGRDLIHEIKNFFKDHGSLFPRSEHPCLVHGDFDPANILLQRREDKWEISAILDWEFSFFGSHLWDLANMLRYAHEMPEVYKKAFMEGYTSQGMQMPPDWEKTLRLLNVSALLDCLARTNVEKCPLRCADIKSLIMHLVSEN